MVRRQEVTDRRIPRRDARTPCAFGDTRRIRASSEGGSGAPPACVPIRECFQLPDAAAACSPAAPLLLDRQYRQSSLAR